MLIGPRLIMLLPFSAVENPFAAQADTPAADELSQLTVEDPTVIFKYESALAAGLKLNSISTTARSASSVLVFMCNPPVLSSPKLVRLYFLAVQVEIRGVQC